MTGLETPETVRSEVLPLAPKPGGRLGPALLVLLVAGLLVLSPFLYPRVFDTSHEARFALLARDMLARGVWFGAERGVVYRNKPPLYPWSIAAISRWQGAVTERTALAPVAVATLATVLFTFLLGDRLFGRRGGIWAALVLVTSYGFFAFSQEPIPDMLVVGFGAVAAYAFWVAIDRPPGRAALVGFYTALAGGVFAKGPEGLLPLLVAIVWLAIREGARGLRRLWSLTGAGVFLFVTAGWLAPYLALGTEGIGRDVAQAGLAAYFGLPRPISLAGQLIRALMGFLPWTLVAPLVFPAALRARRSPAVGFALLWFVVPLGVVLLSHTQRTRYLLPIYPGAALLTAWWADTDALRGGRLARVLGTAAFMAAAAAIAAPLWVRPSARYFVPEYGWESVPLLLGVACLGVALGWGLWGGRTRLLVEGGTVAMLLVLGYGSWLHARWADTTQDYRGLAARIARHAPDTDPAFWVPGTFMLQLDFYLGRSSVPLGTSQQLAGYLARPGRPVAVVERRSWEDLRSELPGSVIVLEAMRVSDMDLLIVQDRGP